MFAEYRLSTMLWAVGLVLFGLILFLLNFNLFAQYEPLPQYILAALFATGAAVFFLGYFAARKEWARLIPAWTLLALAVMALTSTISALDQRITAALLFVGLALAFANIYLLDRRQNWWAMIPGGFMLVIGLVIALSVRITRPRRWQRCSFPAWDWSFWASTGWAGDHANGGRLCRGRCSSYLACSSSHWTRAKPAPCFACGRCS